MPTVSEVITTFDPITLEQMEGVKLMNRIDTKYVIPKSRLPQLLELAAADYYVQQIDGKRVATYDTMYYDTEQLEMYMMHHNRHLVRQKIRVREYVDSELVFLEVKRKNNHGRTKKKRISLPNTDWLEQHDQIAPFLEQKSRYRYEQLRSEMRTQFSRITLVNKAKTERLTIDFNLVWTNQRNGVEVSKPELVIVELKRDGNVPSPMLNIMLQMRVHQLKISKYCIGVALTDHEVKQNRFKIKIRKIEKLINS